jgi:CelD/BcsL family acetyltransferase involved in cellulose biosynthesis
VSIADCRDIHFRAEWQHLVSETTPASALFQSPDWFEHVAATHPQASPLALSVESADKRLGVAPLSWERTTLDFTIRRRTLGRFHLRVVEILGGQPLLPPDPTGYDALFRTIEGIDRPYDCVRMAMIPTDSFAWRYLAESQLIRHNFICYVPDGVNRSRLIALPSTFDEYLAKFSSKTRSELRRQVRRLRDHGGGSQLRRYESSSDVQWFLEAAAPVVAQSWQHTCATGLLDNSPYWQIKLADLACRGYFRSYVLFCGTEPCAVELGYQYGGVFYGIQTHYDQRLARLSPGTVLLYSYLEDLFQHARPRLLSFGYGDSKYKSFFANTFSDDACVLLFRRTLVNELKRSSHTWFRSFVHFLKRRFRPTGTF